MLAWFNHLYICFTDDRWGFLIAGAIMFPIAIVHGVGNWFGCGKASSYIKIIFASIIFLIINTNYLLSM